MGKKSIRKSSQKNDFMTDGGIAWFNDETNKTLTIKPTDTPDEGYLSGQMKDYSTTVKPPWGTITEEGWTLKLQEGLLTIGNRAFYHGSGLSGAIFIPETVTKIGERAFQECSDIDTIRIGSDTMEIGKYAFYQCSDLDTVYFYTRGIPLFGESSFALSKGTVVKCGCVSKDNWASQEIPKVSNSNTEWSFLPFGAFITTRGIEYQKDDANKTLTVRPATKPKKGYARGDTGNYSGISYTPWGEIDEDGWTLVLEEGLTRIGDCCFNDCGGFKHILTIPSTVKEIGWASFSLSGYTGLKFAEGSVLEKMDSSFDNNPKMRGDLILPNSIKDLGYSSFAGCGFDGKLVLPENIEKIPYHCFGGCGDLRGTIVIPDTVTEIEMNAFQNCSWIDTVKIGKGVRKIGYEAFQGCSRMFDPLVIPDNVEEIGYDCFRGARTRIVTIGKGLKALPNGCFSNNDNMAGTITIPENITSIGSSCFEGCWFVSNVYFAGNACEVGENAFRLKKEGTQPTTYKIYSRGNWAKARVPETEFTHWNYLPLEAGGISGGIEWILNENLTIKPTDTPEQGYQKGEMKNYTDEDAPWSRIPQECELIIEEGVTNIGDRAFLGCSGFAHLNLPSTIQYLGMSSFADCTGLSNNLVMIPSSVLEVGVACFINCPNIKGVYFVGKPTLSEFALLLNEQPPQKSYIVYSKNNWAKQDLYDTSAIRWVFEDTVSHTDGGIEWEMDAETKVLTIKPAFSPEQGYDVGQMKDYETTGNIPPWDVIVDTGWTLIIKEGVKNIGTYAFANSTGLQNILEIPPTVKKIGRGSFIRCRGFKGLTLNEGLEEIGSTAFSYCTGMEGSLTLNEGLETLSTSAFENCSGFTGELIIPNSLSAITDSAFKGCTGIKEVVLGNGVVSISPNAFNGCSGMDGDLIIPSNVGNIETNAFRGCTNLKALKFMGNGIVFGDDAFNFNPQSPIKTYECYSPNNWASSTIPQYDYTKWTYRDTINGGADGGIDWVVNTATRILTISASDSPEQGYQKGQMKPYNAYATPWDEYVKADGWQIVIQEGVINIGNTAFGYNTHYTGSITIPSSVKTIEVNAFSHCLNLETLIIKEGVETIESNAFNGCTGLTEVIPIPASVSEVKDGAFQDCSNLEGVYFIGSSITLGTDAFTLKTFAPQTTYDCYSKNNWVIGTLTDTTYTKWNFKDTENNIDGGIEWFKNDTTKTLTIRPAPVPQEGYTRGQMKNYSSGSGTPWGKITQSGWTLILEERVTDIGNNAFNGSSGFTGQLKLPSTTKTIGQYAFANCKGFTGVLEIPKSIQTLQDCFWNCTGLSKLVFSEGLQTISGAFNGCTGLSGHLVIPRGVREISNHAFYLCNNITAVMFIGGRLNTLESSALELNDDGATVKTYECYSPNNWANGVLQQMTWTKWRFLDLTTNTDGGVIWIKDDENKTLTFFPAEEPEEGFLSGQMKNYEMSSYTPWGIITEEGWKLVFDEGVIYIGNYTFSNSTGFQCPLVLPSSLIKIGKGAFSNCNGFTGALEFPEGMDSIEMEAFAGASGFNGELVIPKTLKTIKSSVFSGVSNITAVRFEGDKPDTLGSRSFSLVTRNPPKTFDCISPNNWARGVLDTAQVSGNYTQWRFYDPSMLIDGGIEWKKDDATKTLFIQPTYTPEEGFETGQMRDYTDHGAWGTITEEGWTLSLGEGITNIGRYSFNGCTGFTNTLLLPSTVKKIGQWAFYGCSNMTGNLAIPNATEEIESRVFENCSKLGPVLQLGQTLNTIQFNAFTNCSGFTGELIIPNSVTFIGTNGFEGCTGFTGLTIGNKLKDICKKAFLSCSGLVGKLNIPDTVKSIGGNAFEGCTGIEDLEISKNMTLIKESAFKDCPSIATVRFRGETVPTIESEAFNLGGDYEHQCYSHGNWAETVLTGDVIKTTRFRFHDSSLNIDGGIIWTKDEVNKRFIIAPTDEPEEGYMSGEMKDYESIAPWGNIKGDNWTLKFEEGVLNVGKNSFWNSTGITTLQKLPNSVATIGDGAFRGCTGLTEMVIPANINKIGVVAFMDCYNITSFTFEGEKPQIFEVMSMRLGNSSHPVVCHCYSPNNWAEEVVPGLSDVNTTWIFNGVQSHISGGIEWIMNEETKVLTITPTDEPEEGYLTGQMKDYATIGEWGTITEEGWTILIASGVTNIGDNAFNGCSGFTENLTIPDTVERIGATAFKDCSALTKVSLGTSLSSVGNNAFNGCHSVIQLAFNGLTQPSMETGCLTFGTESHHANIMVSGSDWITLEILETVSDNNTTFRLPGPDNKCGDNLTYRIENDNLIIDGFGDMWDYDAPNVPPWFSIADRILSITLPNGMTSIGNGAFAETTKITVIRMPLSVERIGNNAFLRSGITAIVFLTNDKRNGATTIGDYAFSGCANLQTLHLPSSLQTLGTGVFKDCIRLKNLTLGSVGVIGDGAFAGCKAIRELTLPSTVTAVGTKILYGCTGLKGLTFLSPQKFATVDESMAVGWEENPMVINAYGSDWVEEGAFSQNELGLYTQFLYDQPPIPPEPVEVSPFNPIDRVGWIQSAMVQGECLKNDYVGGGVPIELPFRPDIVIGVQVDCGHSGFYDITSQKLRIYDPTGSEGITAPLVNYTVVLMRK